jgi:hypothetical protein
MARPKSVRALHAPYLVDSLPVNARTPPYSARLNFSLPAIVLEGDMRYFVHPQPLFFSTELLERS